ncbi:DUF502 domain-containing protein [Halovenus sp. HT40]|uniref:DUF502 domain-containing protein n=1 Tax=Halovenus sp. HT40 TaxID=3126691 RepID=UPI003FA54EEB
MASWKRDFASGLIILVPLLVTVVVLAWIYNRLTQVPIPVDSEPTRALLSIVIFVLLVFSVGYLMRTAVGSVLERALDDVMNQLPGLRVIYNASKMAVETALSGTSDLQAPVRLEVWDGLRMTAFKTGKTTTDGREILFLPTAPNITTGFVIEVEKDRYEEIDDSVEHALTRLLSAGFGEQDDNRGERSIREILDVGGESPAERAADEASVDSIDEATEAPATGSGSADTDLSTERTDRVGDSGPPGTGDTTNTGPDSDT